CVRAVVRFASKARLAALRDYLACKSDVLESAAFSDPQSLVDCFVADRRRARLLARAGVVLVETCAAIDTTAVVPGACTGAPNLAECIARRAACRMCRVETAADHIGADCDLRDDEEINDSCPNTF